jgi:two-component system cell cycle response regulator
VTGKNVKPWILVVEDEPALAKVLKMRLEIEGFDVDTAGDGAEAMQKIGARRPDLVLCDLMMPVMDGYQVTAAIKGDAKLRDIPVLILSALKQAKETERLARLGANGFAAKPFDSKELTARIRELIAK